MAITLPTAPKNFYTPSLQELRDVLLQTNGSTKGVISLITDLPTDIEDAWAEVGAGNHEIDDYNNFGSLVVGSGQLDTISDVLPGLEESVGEVGYKIQIGAIPEIKVLIDGSTTTTATVIAACLLVGRDFFSNGSNSDLRYIVPINNLVVTDNQLLSTAGFEVNINYAEELIVTP